MQLNEFLERLKTVKGNGNQYTAICPAHTDKDPSLSVSEANGKILLHCHAGCTTENILGVIGLDMKDLFIEPAHKNSYADNGNSTANGKPKREVAAVYDYKDLFCQKI